MGFISDFWCDHDICMLYVGAYLFLSAHDHLPSSEDASVFLWDAHGLAGGCVSYTRPVRPRRDLEWRSAEENLQGPSRVATCPTPLFFFLIKVAMSFLFVFVRSLKKVFIFMIFF